MSILKKAINILKTPLNINKIKKLYNLPSFKKKSFVTFVILIAFVCLFIKVYPDMKIRKIDDPSYYTAALGISKSINIYDPSKFSALGEAIFGKSINVWPYIYPPLLAEIISVLFSEINYQTYTKILFLFNILLSLLLPFSIYLIFHSQKDESYFPTLYLVFIFNFNIPLIRTIGNGQINLLILILLIFAFYYYKKNYYFFSSLFLALACLIKIFPILFLLIMFIQKKIKFLFLFFVNLFSIIIISIIFFGNQLWVDFGIQFLQNLSGSKNNSFYLFYYSAINNNSLRAFFYQLSQLYDFPQNISILATLLLILILVTTCLISIKHKNNSDFSFSLLIVTYILISPISWVHHYVLMIVPLYYILLKIFENSAFHLFAIFLPIGAIITSFPLIAGFPFNQLRLFALIIIYFLLIYLEKTSLSSLQ